MAQPGQDWSCVRALCRRLWACLCPVRGWWVVSGFLCVCLHLCLRLCVRIVCVLRVSSVTYVWLVVSCGLGPPVFVVYACL